MLLLETNKSCSRLQKLEQTITNIFPRFTTLSNGVISRLYYYRITNIEFTVAVITIAFVYFIYRHFMRIRRYPSGPFPLPFIGNLLQINTAYPHISMVKWQKKYGNIFTVWLPKPTVVIAEWKELQKTLLGLQGERCLNRPASFVYGLFTEHKPEGDGIILSSGNTWRTQRRFAVSVFKKFGMGGSKMEEQINFHKDDLINRLANEKKAEIINTQESFIIDDIHSQLAFCFGNVIHDLIMGRHYEFNDPEFLCFKNHIDNTLKRVASVPMLIIDCYPWMRFFFPQYYQYLKDGYAMQQFFLKEIEQHAINLDINSEPTNFIDAYLQEMFELEDLQLSKKTLALDVGDLWTGGLETVVTTLTWAIIYLIRYPRVQQLLHAELDSQLKGEVFKMTDRRNLPYLKATIDELQRIVNVLPWHIPHAIDSDMIIGQKFLSSGTIIMPQFGAVFFNKKLFPNPELFLPERFLEKVEISETVNINDHKTNYNCNNTKKSNEIYSKNNKSSINLKQQCWKYVGSEYIAPFGLGKRACLGEGLARMELFIILAGLLQNFSFEQFDENLPSIERTSGMTSKPKPFKCRVWRRNTEPITTQRI